MSKPIILTLFTFLLATPAMAQQQAADNTKAPWWMATPVMASTGYVRAELLANRGRVVANFQVTERDLNTATAKATDKVRALGVVLGEYGRERVSVETSLSTRPIYQQYRDRDGNMVDYDRPDRIDRYEATTTVSVEIRDIAVVKEVFGILLAAQPNSIGRVDFSLQPTNENLTEMFNLATADAHRRAVEATQAAGATLGSVRLIDPTGRACETGVLVAGAAASAADGFGMTTVNLRNLGSGRTLLTVNGRRLGDDANTSNGGASVTGGANQNAGNVPLEILQQAEVLKAGAGAGLALALEPPIVEIRDRVCVVYALN